MYEMRISILLNENGFYDKSKMWGGSNNDNMTG